MHRRVSKYRRNPMAMLLRQSRANVGQALQSGNLGDVAFWSTLNRVAARALAGGRR